MNDAFLLTGGNLGDRLAYLQQAITFIEQLCGPVLQRSSVYETAAWGVTDQPLFYNQVLHIQTHLTPALLMETLLMIEEKMGRRRLQKMGPRIIDLDILLLNDAVINTELLTVPHPHLTERRFALLPLAEIAPDKIHPVAKKNILQLLAECADTLDVHKIYSAN